MKHFITGFLLFLIFSCGLSAQTVSLDPPSNVNVKEGPVFSTDNSLENVLGKDGDKVYAQMSSSRVVKFGNNTKVKGLSISVARFNEKMELELEKELNLEMDGNELKFEILHMSGEGLLLFTSFANTDEGKKYLYMQIIDKQSLEVTGNTVVVAEMPFTVRNDGWLPSFIVRRSPDNSKLLIFHHQEYQENSEETLACYVFDNSSVEKWKGEITIPYSDKIFQRITTRVADSGDVFLMGKLYNEEADRTAKNKNFKYLIAEYEQAKKEWKGYEIDLGDRHIKEIMPALNNEGKLVCGGFYGDSSKDRAWGSFFVTIDRETKQVIHKSIQEFELSFILEGMDVNSAKRIEKSAKKGNKVGLSDLSLDKIVKRDDGGMIAVGEQFYVIETSSTFKDQNSRPGMPSNYKYESTTTREEHYYDDIILVGMDPTGDIEWTVKIPKRQLARTSGPSDPYGAKFLSYETMVIGSSLYLIYNDNSKNLTSEGKGKIELLDFRKPLVVIAKIDSKGNVSKNGLLSSDKRNDVMAQPVVSKQMGSHEMLMYMERKKDKSFARIAFDKQANP